MVPYKFTEVNSSHPSLILAMTQILNFPANLPNKINKTKPIIKTDRAIKPQLEKGKINPQMLQLFLSRELKFWISRFLLRFTQFKKSVQRKNRYSLKNLSDEKIRQKINKSILKTRQFK